MATIGSTPHSGRNYYSGAEKVNAAKNADALGDPGAQRRAEQKSSQADVDGRPVEVATKFQDLPGNPIDRSKLGFVGYSWELPAEDYQRILRAAQNSLTSAHTSEPEMPDFSDYAGIKPFAEIVVGGKVVATIDNQGMVRAGDDRLAERLHGLSEGTSLENGPDLAQKLAQQISRLLGGQVQMTDTALTQAQFDGLPPPPRPTAAVDYEGMQGDPRYDQLQSMVQKRADYLGWHQSIIDASI